MADNFLNRLYQNPRQPLDAASITRVDELGNGYDDWNNLIQPKFQAPEQTWGETALGVATAPARIATSLVESLSPYGADGWQVPPLVQEGANALTAVGDAYNYGMDQDEINNRALGMAGFMMGGGGIAAGRAPMIAANASKEGAIPALMNYDVPDVFYHGTPDASFSKFNIDEIRARAPEQNNGFAGVSMSPYPDEASGYASLRGAAPGMFPLRSDATNPFVWNVDDFYDGKMPKYQFGKLKGDEPATLQRLRGVIPDYKFRGGDFPSYGFGMSEALAAAGYDALDIVHGGKLSERAALAPNTVRSATTGETLFSNASKEASAIPALVAGQEAKPIRAYHGAGAPIEGKFDPSRTKAGPHLHPRPYFADDPAEASGYALNRNQTLRADAQGAEATAPNVTPVDIYMQNPFDASAMRNFKQGGYDYEYIDPAEYARLIGREHTGVNKPTGHDALRDMWHQEMGRFMPRSARKYQGAEYGTPEYKIYNDAYGALYEPDTMRKAWDRVYKRLEKAGYDGLRKRDTISDYSDEKSYTQLIPFKKGTVKSATTGETLFSNASKEAGALPALLGSGQEQDIPDWLLPYLGR